MEGLKTVRLAFPKRKPHWGLGHSFKLCRDLRKDRMLPGRTPPHLLSWVRAGAAPAGLGGRWLRAQLGVGRSSERPH